MGRILIVYYSRTGHTKRLAQELARRCDADLERIGERGSRRGAGGYLRSSVEAMLGWRPPLKPARHNPRDYDLVILGTPVWFWNMSSPMRAWIHRHRDDLTQVAMFCTYGGSGYTDALDGMERLCGHAAVARLALTQSAAEQCQHDPALDRFLLELGGMGSAGVASDADQGRAHA
ncbi:flavodoxin family protein [Comamonas granuli]|uniref:flavodoxin family protein n=1 Tax=Comamonas granuli TaxID=290309 RepID=UPI0005A6A1DB|nr:flavodoxin [Comamonas granuli]